MKSITSSLITVLAVASKPNLFANAKPQGKDRIVGGTQAEVGDYPYIVQMNGCGGALIAPDIVLFAAHCGDQFLDQQVNIGAYKTRSDEEGAQSRFCDEWIADPLYGTGGNPGEYTPNNYDFALCKLDKPVQIDDSKVTLVLNEEDAFPSVGEELRVMGFGTLEHGVSSSPTYLQHVLVPYISNDQCNAESGYGGLSGGKVTDTMLCAGFPEGGKDACQGDSGGPLVRRTTVGKKTVDIHVGVVSWGIGCAEPDYAGVYARTSKRVGWIRETMCTTLNSISEDCAGYRTEPLALPTCDGPELTVQLETDFFGRETSWYLRHSSGRLIKRRRYLLDLHKSETSVCLERGQCYTFEILDSYGDGMCYNNNCGSYTLKIDRDKIVEGDGSFGKVKVEPQFCTATNPPTKSPTDPPTPFPTNPPTAIPTNPPTAIPTNPPTAIPTNPPTAIPTNPPTAIPTNPPTAIPTNPPTAIPTNPPTASPTQSPVSSVTITPATPPPNETPAALCTNQRRFRRFCRNIERNPGRRNRTAKRRCRQKKGRKFVYAICAKTCGKLAGLGRCA